MADSKNKHSIAQEQLRKAVLKAFKKEQEDARFMHTDHSVVGKFGKVICLNVAVEKEKCLRAKLPQFDPENISYLCEKMKPIFVKDLQDSYNLVFTNCLLKLTIIDDPVLMYDGMLLAVEDEKGDVSTAFIYKLPENEKTYEALKLNCGTIIGIVHPFQRGAQAIRVEDPKTVVVFGEKKNMCRYCGKENAKNKCAICKRSYCGRECQVLDWKELNHKKICAKIDWCKEPKRLPDIKLPGPQ